ncbi:MAG: endonuclease/exonuclease/phosphatase family protein [Bacteroidales bacterium]|nr:endonuclease/exonuclease/phosphatase family protein [Bacteroidales bacterium]
MKLKMKIISILMLLLPCFFAIAQQKNKSLLVMFYNVENLYDTIDDPAFNDEEFLPNGANKWNGEKYRIKLENVSKVISDIGATNKMKCPAVIGLCEVENETVLRDLANTQRLKSCNYDAIIYNSRYNRGVDVALMYQKDRMAVVNSVAYPLYNPDDSTFTTRDQLLVTGIIEGEVFHFIVNHWPSRRGGEERSAPLREMAAKLCRHIVDSIFRTDSLAKIIIMGDLNDDPTNKSVLVHLNAKPEKTKVNKGDLYNPMYDIFVKKGIGSLAYNDKWNLFDQFIVSYSLISNETKGYKLKNAAVFNANYLMQKEGQFAGYPFRTYVGNTFTGGYSDHFPSYILLQK